MMQAQKSRLSGGAMRETWNRHPRTKFFAFACFVIIQIAFSYVTAVSAEGNGESGSGTIPLITEYVKNGNFERIDGFLPLYRNIAKGTLLLEIPESGAPDFLYQSILTSGFGSRDLANPDDWDALDRGKLGQSGLAVFRQFGKRVLLIERNTTYYTPSAALDSPDDAGLSFPNSVIAGFDVVAREGNKLLIDATDFFGRDGIDVPAILKSADQGSYSLDEKRSAVDVSLAHATGGSIEVDALLTFTTSDPPPDRDIISRVAAERSTIFVHERNALIRLPDLKTSNFRPRIFDPRSGFFDNTFYDPALLPNRSTRQSFIVRHDLSKKNPDDQVSEPVRPIIFYIDPAVPLALHPLIVEAAGWWNPAFEAAGFKNAMQVRELPPGADPFASGTNIVLWVPRETRGYSVGSVVTDPRTGQILKAIIRIDAMRMQADRLLLDALTSPYGDRPDFTPRDETLRQRFKLMVAHEIGHTLGLRHQFIASAQGMSSVMDYPFPNISLAPTGAPVLRDVFPQGIGAWDKAAILYGYHPFPPGEEAASLRSLVAANEEAGLYWMTDQDVADANPLVQKWDRGTDPVAELTRILTIRHAALARFSKYAIPADEPLAVLQDALVPLYLLHQFEVKAVASMLGGYAYRYSLRDEEGPAPVPASRQRQALQALLLTLDTATLWPDQRVLELMTPRPPTYPASDESFGGSTGQIFDALRPVETAASVTMGQILQTTRAARLAQAKAQDANALGLDEVLAEVVTHTWKANPQRGSAGAAQRAIALTVLRSLLTSATSKTSPMVVRGACWVALDDIAKWTRTRPAAAEWEDAFAFASHAISAAERQAGAFELPQRRAITLDPMGDLD